MQSKQIHELVFSLRKYPAAKVEKVHFSNHGYEHTSVTPPDCSNESLRLAFPECIRNR